MGSRSTLAGVEVPIIGSDSLKWVDLSVGDGSRRGRVHDLLPSAAAEGNSDATIHSSPTSLLPEDCAACSVIGDPPLCLIWRIKENSSNVLELLELSGNKEFPRTGLRLVFPDALCPFAYIYKNEISSSAAHPHLLYAVTVSGVAYLLKLRTFAAYSSSCAFLRDEYIELNLVNYCNNVQITSISATAGCLVVGRNDGSVACFRLGLLDHAAPGFVHELRDDFGIGRLWGFMSRGRMVGAVQHLVISELHGLKLLFVLHSDGIIRVWDLSNHSKILSHTISFPNKEGASTLRLWVGESDNSSIVPLAILYRNAQDISMEFIDIYSLHFTLGERTILSMESSMLNIPLEEGNCIDVKLTSDKVWILKDNGLVYHSLQSNNTAEEPHYYTLQEELVAEQLFQSSEPSSNDLLWVAHSIFSSMKDQIVPFLSSIFLRRLVQPGIHQSAVLRSTLMSYNRHWTDNEFQSLTVDALKMEIRSLIEYESVGESPTSIFCNWREFCSRYYHNWCKFNSPCGLIIQSSVGAVAVVRKSSVSLFRDLENVELFLDGSDELVDLASFGLDLSDENSEHEILLEVLRCIMSLSQQLAKPASALFYESLVSTPIISSEEIIPRLLKILETGYGLSVSSAQLSDLGGDFAWEKELADHKNFRKFSIDMLISLHGLSKRATSWGKILDVIESYLQFLVPQKTTQKSDTEMSLYIGSSVLVQATSQIARMMFESAFDTLLFLSYLLKISGQINMLYEDISRIELELFPMIQETVSEWVIIHFLGTTPSEAFAVEDFSSQLSTLQIDNRTDRRSWNSKLGKCDFTLAFILLTMQASSGGPSQLNSHFLPNPHDIVASTRHFISWIIWGKTGEECSSFLRRSTELAPILLRYGQYDAVEHLLILVEENSRREKISKSIQDTDGDWCVLQHILGCCLLAQARYGYHGMSKERKVCESIRCFFRASSGLGASQALLALSHDVGLPPLGLDGGVSSTAWKLHYYQWAMQIFEQHDISDGACQFALAALEQVDEALIQTQGSNGGDSPDESATSIRGRLWANVFKFSLDLNYLYDAYCAILTNPDVESKYICLRRFIIVLYERGAMKVLLDGQLPFIGLAEKIERELAWKAERSEILAKPSPYKLLYAFEMHQHNWRKAASYIYQYSTCLRTEVVLKDHQHVLLVLQERLSGLSAAINALHLVHPSYAWIEPPLESGSLHNEHLPSKKAKKMVKEQGIGSDFQPQSLQFCLDIEKLEKEFLLTSAEYLLSLANVKWTSTGTEKAPSDLVDLLIEKNLCDITFSVVFKFWKGSELKRELESIFSALSLKCCPSKIGSSGTGVHSLLLTSSMGEMVSDGPPDVSPTSQQSAGSIQWETLELYLQKYRTFHAGLPVIVAETLLQADPQIELPLWLVRMFKDGRRDRIWGMTGQESNPALLLRLYVQYGRNAEAINLLHEYIESFASVRPSDVINRKKPFSVWFPYTTIERLWCQLEESIKLGYMVDQSNKLKNLLRGSLMNHLKLLKVDNEDVLSSAEGQ